MMLIGRASRASGHRGMELRFGQATWPSAVVAGVVGSVLLVGCSASTGDAVGESDLSPSMPHSIASSVVRQTDEAGRQLPFQTAFPNRWSANNDGSPYEPCTALSEDMLLRAGMVPASAMDAAVADGQTARGCVWRVGSGHKGTISQIVGNLTDPQDGLTGYKRLNSSGIEWFADTRVDGRTVAVGSSSSAHCLAVVQSQRAIVATIARMVALDRPPVPQICERAIAFTRATIDQIPR
ncbi:DUF3558 family protein [Gordonia sp. ABSL1-1]|uniref:DUF3558 family protein n=1 Tax=Gordonia sp. ABSL1-1 TaxID=3053923 RepID=UPI00336582B8